MITSTASFGSGMCSISPLRNSTLVTPALRWFSRARASISSVMSSPYALPSGPTRRAESKTSMPPPEPRSSTISPARNSASAVGLVRSKSGHGDDLVEWAERPALRVDNAHPLCVTSELACQKAGHQAQPPRLDELTQAGAQAAAGRERVGIAAAVHRTDVAPTHGPGDRCPWFGQGEVVQVEQGVERGVPTTNHQEARRA